MTCSAGRVVEGKAERAVGRSWDRTRDLRRDAAYSVPRATGGAPVKAAQAGAVDRRDHAILEETRTTRKQRHRRSGSSTVAAGYAYRVAIRS